MNLFYIFAVYLKIVGNNINETGTTYKDLLEIIRKKDEQIANKDQQINNLLELLKK